MNEDQVWEQLDIRTKNICQMLELILDGQDDGELDSSMERASSMLDDGEGEDIHLADFSDGIDSDEDSLDQSDDGDDDEGSSPESSNAEDIATDDASSSERSDQDDIPSSMLDVNSRYNTAIPENRDERSEAQLDDGFFSLASFNTETERAEAMTPSNGHPGGEGDSDDNDSSFDLFAPLDQVESSHDKEDPDEEVEGIESRCRFCRNYTTHSFFFSGAFYHDFFEPPSQSQTKTAPKRNYFPDSSGQVHFHDEVKVMDIEARRKGLPVSHTEDTGSGDDVDGFVKQSNRLQERNYQKTDPGSEQNLSMVMMTRMEKVNEVRV